VERIALIGDELCLEVLPALGGKISVLRRRDGENVLLTPPELPFRIPDVDGAFDAHDTSGFDECFPTVAACTEGGRNLPDHGQIWSRRARVTREESALRIESELPGARFTRTLRLAGDTLQLDYEVLGERPTAALWSSHPLLAARPGMQILLPRCVRELLVEWSSDVALGSRVAWPSHHGARLDVLLPPTAARAHKLFTDVIAADEGACALYDPVRDTAVTFRFDPKDVPCIGLWVCEGGWPTTRASKHYTVALEPCSGRPDSLAEAVALGTSFQLPTIVPRRWTVMMSISRGRPRGPFHD